MGIATSDGKYFDDEMELYRDSYMNSTQPQVLPPSTVEEGTSNMPVLDPQLLKPEANEAFTEFSSQSRARSDLSPDAPVSPLEGSTEAVQNVPLPTPRPESAKDKRFQFWPERLIRDVVDKVYTGGTKFGDAVSGKRPMTMDEMVDFTTEVAGLLTTGGSMTAPMREAGVGVFGGMVGAKRMAPNVSELMPRLEKALPEEEITKLTGMWKGAEGKWRFEIPDKDASLFTGKFKEMVDFAKLADNTTDAAILPLDAVLKHNKLFEVYPELQNYTVLYQKGDSNDYSALFWQHSKTIQITDTFLKQSKEEQMKTILHEIQHGLQGIEGFLPGGSWEQSKHWRKAMELEPKLEQAVAKYHNSRKPGPMTMDDVKTVTEINNANRTLLDLKDKAKQEYMNLAGEKEAREVERRYSAAIAENKPKQSGTVVTAPKGAVNKSEAQGSSYEGLPKGYSTIENALTEYARGNITSKEVQKVIKNEGWTGDLRRGKYDFELFDPSGKAHYIVP